MPQWYISFLSMLVMPLKKLESFTLATHSNGTLLASNITLGREGLQRTSTQCVTVLNLFCHWHSSKILWNFCPLLFGLKFLKKTRTLPNYTLHYRDLASPSNIRLFQMCFEKVHNWRAHIRHQCRKTTVLCCHRCLINTGVEKLNYI